MRKLIRDLWNALKPTETVVTRDVVSRPQVFLKLYDKHYAALAGQVWACGGIGRAGGWGGGATRSRVRLLARKMAREDMARELARLRGVA